MAETGVLKVMSALAVETAFTRSILPEFEKASGLAIEMIWDPTTVLMKRIADGERADVVLLIDNSMDALVAEKIVEPESRVAVAQALVGVAAKAGAAHPDISTVEAFKTAMTSARAVAYSRGGASGIYFAELIQRLGIADAVNERAVTIPAGFTAEKVVSGEAELAIQQVSELMSVEGVEVVGPLPEGAQKPTDFSAAIFAGAENRDGARLFLEALTSEAASKAYREGGLVSRLTHAG